jgi:hypothetical protein
VAVKVLNAQGWGTNYGIAVGVNYCADRADVKVLNMSLGSKNDSTAVHNAIDYAVNSRNKLVVAEAGDDGEAGMYVFPLEPARWADETPFKNKLLAVAAMDNGDTTAWVCRADYSQAPHLISVVAPGTHIYSTLPYEKPFYLKLTKGYTQNYDYLSGTSMATAYVSAAAARRWGYKPLESNAQVGLDVKTISFRTVTANDACWPANMSGVHVLSVADLLDRGAGSAQIRNATTGLPLLGATLQAYKSNVLVGSGLVSTININNVNGSVDILNLPVGDDYVEKVNKTGFTSGPQPAFQHPNFQLHSHSYIPGGQWTIFGIAFIPPKSSNIDVVAGWTRIPDQDVDLDLDIWLPYVPNPLDPGQPAPFVVGDWDGADAHGFLEGYSAGTLLAFPFAILNREGGTVDLILEESVTISSRKAHAPRAATPALPYFASSSSNPYWVELWDHNASYNSFTMIHESWPYAYVWKDGVIKGFAENPLTCNKHQWWPFKIYGGVTGTLQVDVVKGCGSGYYPYDIGFATDIVTGGNH